MIYHIDRDRYKRLRAAIHRAGARWNAEEIHLINGEHAHCVTCNLDVDSMKAETPTDFEAEKTVLLSAVEVAPRQ